jgi:uncharacterized protein
MRSTLENVTHQLTRDQARRIVVRAQLLDADRPSDVVEVAEQLGQIKIDPTNTIAPAEHSILWARIGNGYEQHQLTQAVEHDHTLFEHLGTYRPVSLLPLMLPGMRREPTRQRHREWLDANAGFKRDVLDRLTAEGPLLAADIPDTAAVAAKEDGWYGPNQVPLMLEFLQLQGEIGVVGREGRSKRFDIAARAFPRDLPEHPFDEAERMLNERRLQAFGLAKQKSPYTPVGDAGEPATVEGSRWTWRVDPRALAALDDDPGGRVAFLNPYDGLLFDRPRLSELFEFDYVLEQFKKKHERRYGFFAYPILMGDRFVGMLEAEVDRTRELLVVAAVHEFLPFEAEEDEMVRAEIADLAEWLGVGLQAW